MIATRLVDTTSTPILLNSLRSNKIDPKLLITHWFKLLHFLGPVRMSPSTSWFRILANLSGTENNTFPGLDYRRRDQIKVVSSSFGH